VDLFKNIDLVPLITAPLAGSGMLLLFTHFLK